MFDKRIWPALALLAFVYLVTQTGNTFEALDGYDYALAAETIPITDAHDTRSILFHKINRVLFVAGDMIGIAPRAYEFLRVLDCLVGALAVGLLGRLLVRLYRLPPTASMLGAAMLAACYGFWRYAGEVEVYIPSIALILSALNLITDVESRGRRHLADLAPAGVLAGLAVLYYQPNAIPLFLAMPVLILTRANFTRAVVYAGTGGATILAGLVATYLARETAPLSIGTLLAFINDRGGEFPLPGLSLWSFGQALMAITHDFLSTHWLYGFDGVTQWLERALPRRAYRFEETIFAARLARPAVYLPLVILPLLAAAIAAVAWRIAHGPRLSWRPALSSRPVLFAAAWFVLHGAIVLPLDPATEEVWIIALTPLVILLSVLVIGPAVAVRGVALVAAIVALMAAHNLLAGLNIYRDGQRDLRTIRSAWLAANARPGDAVVFSEVRHMTFAHLRYRLGLDIIHAWPGEARTVGIDPRRTVTGSLDALIGRVHARGGRVFAFGDLVAPGPRLLALEGPAIFAAAEQRAQALAGRATRVDKGPYGDVYRIEPAAAR